ncbi:hypothetical protein ABBQ38_004127 [Trebouxia sp. C0009 RCD-2024]
MDKQWLQQMLLFGCCECLQAVRLNLTAAHLSLNNSAAVPALGKWIATAVSAKAYEPLGGTATALDCRRDPMFLIRTFSKLSHAALCPTLICTIVMYLDTQQKWHECATSGCLHYLLGHLTATVEVFLGSSQEEISTHDEAISKLCSLPAFQPLGRHLQEMLKVKPYSQNAGMFSKVQTAATELMAQLQALQKQIGKPSS